MLLRQVHISIINCPGNVFERKYNASSIVKLNAGKIIRSK